MSGLWQLVDSSSFCYFRHVRSTMYLSLPMTLWRHLSESHGEGCPHDCNLATVAVGPWPRGRGHHSLKLTVPEEFNLSVSDMLLKRALVFGCVSCLFLMRVRTQRQLVQSCTLLDCHAALYNHNPSRVHMCLLLLLRAWAKVTALHDVVGMLTRCLGHASGVSFWMFRAFGLGASAEYATFMGSRKPLLVLFGLTEQERWVNDPVGIGRQNQPRSSRACSLSSQGGRAWTSQSHSGGTEFFCSGL